MRPMGRIQRWRTRLAIAMVKWAPRVDGRRDVSSSISYHHPQNWSGR